MRNFKEKLASRKFWAAFAGFVSALLFAFGVPTLTTEQVLSVISAAGVLIAYILGESYVDAQKTPENREGDEL